MNKYQGYKETIRNNYPPSNYTMLREALDEAMFLMDKEIPMKLVMVHDEETGDFIRAECGRCNTNLHFFDRCPSKKCGQVADWSEDDE